MMEHKNEYSSFGSFEPETEKEEVKVKEKKSEEKGFGNYEMALRDV
jgi:hypothetical protein